MLNYEQLLADPQVEHNGTFIEIEHPTEGTLKLPGIPIRFAGSPGTIRRHQPDVGEHSAEVLTEAGLSAEEIALLHESGAIALAADADAHAPANG